MKVLVVGYGSMGRRHALNARALGHDVFVVDRAAERRSQAERDCFTAWFDFGDEVVRDLRLREVGIDACVIATPCATHVAVAADLLAAGYSGPLFVEKPLARTAQEAAPFAAWPSLLQVGYMLRWHPTLLRFKAAILRDGAPSNGMFYVLCDKSKWPGAAYEDMLLEASHELDLALWLMGPAVVLSAAHASQERWHALLQHQDCATSAVVLDGTYRGARRDVRLFAELPDTHELMTWRWDNSAERLYRDELGDFFALCEGRLPQMRCDVEDAMRVLKLCDDIRESAA